MGVSPWGRAQGGLERSPASWMAGKAGVGLRQWLATRAERERGWSWAKWGEGCARGTGGALRRELGAWAGVVAEKFDDVRKCARADPRWAKGAELTGWVHGAERGERGVRGNISATSGPGPREREGAREEENWHRQAGPIRQWAREGAREGELPLTGGVRLSYGAGARARGLAGPTRLVWAAFSFSFSLNFLIPFPFLFL
jgi:hypothetical protein